MVHLPLMLLLPVLTQTNAHFPFTHNHFLVRGCFAARYKPYLTHTQTRTRTHKRTQMNATLFTSRCVLLSSSQLFFFSSPFIMCARLWAFVYSSADVRAWLGIVIPLSYMCSAQFGLIRSYEWMVRTFVRFASFSPVVSNKCFARTDLCASFVVLPLYLSLPYPYICARTHIRKSSLNISDPLGFHDTA